MSDIGNKLVYGSPNCPGITYREWLIGMALQGETASDIEGKFTPSQKAQSAIEAADQVLEQLEQEKEDERLDTD